jgi:hypothetical protein
MTREQIEELAAAALVAAEAYKEAIEALIAGYPETAGKIVVEIVPISFTAVLAPAEGFEEVYPSLIQTFGFQNG